MKFSFNKIRSTIIKKDKIDETEDSTYLEKIMEPIKEKPFALSSKNIMFTGMNELAGYYYFRTIIVGKFKLKTFKGAELIINCKNLK